MPQDVQTEIFKTSDGCPISYRLRPIHNPGVQHLVLIHSLALDGSVWDGVAARLADQANILTYDCRGHGRSGRKAMPFTMERFAQDLAELLDHLGWQTAIVIGCSMGGCVAQAFAGKYPARVRGLGLIDTTAWYGHDAPMKWRERADTARVKGLHGLVEFQVTRWFGEQFRSSHPELISATTRVFLGNDLDCYAASCAMLGDADLRPYLPSLRMPVAIVVGEEDSATPVSAARQLHEAIPGSTLTILPGARHLTPIESPEQIASQVVALLRRI